MDSPWRIELLGRLRAAQGDREVSRFRSHQTAVLLAYLAYYRDRSHPREELIELLWPACDPAAGRNRLRVALTSLRHQLEPPGIRSGAVIVADRHTIRLNPVTCVTDVMAFEAAVQSAGQTAPRAARVEQLMAAVDLYRGELLPGYFEAWVLTEREHLAEVCLQALGQLIALLEQEGDLRRALPYARRAVAIDPLREEARRDLMRLLAVAGEPEAALRQYQELERLLTTELRAAPEAALRALGRDLAALAEAQRLTTGVGAATAQDGCQPPSAAGIRSTGIRTARREHRQAENSWAEAPSSARSSEPFPLSRPPFPSPGAALVRSGHLPLQITRFFGREEEIARLEELLRDERTRLVTLTGPGGSGKTRLALELASRLQHGRSLPFSHLTKSTPPTLTTWFVPLVDVTDPHLILDRIIDALGLPRAAYTDPLEQVLAFLSSRLFASRVSAERGDGWAHERGGQGCGPSLLLDNFEHLVPEGVPLVRMLLERVDGLTVLVTSRQRLDLEGEQEFPVGPLATPALGEQSPEPSAERRIPSEGRMMPEALLQYPSVRLFVDRAQAVRPDFQVTASNATAVAAVCRQLEGLPLALELAAAWIGVLTPQHMLARLEHRFELLVGRQRKADPRHRSLKATLDWSYHLLSPEVQRLFVQLSVFRGGWTLEAAEAVCDQPRALEFLEQLRACSLVLAEEVGVRCSIFGVRQDYPQYRTPNIEHRNAEMRYRLLETLREYGAEQLTPDERAALARRHALCYLALAERAEPQLRGPDQAAWLDRLAIEHDNLRAALDWAAESGEVEVGLRLGGALGHFWAVRVYWVEGWQRLAQLLALDPDESRRRPSRLPKWPRATETPAARLAAVRAKALQVAGGLAFRQSDWKVARSLLEESLAICRDLGDRWGIARSLNNLAIVAYHQDKLETARSLLDECLEICRETGDSQVRPLALNNLAMLLSDKQQDDATAAILYGDALAVARESGDKWAISLLLSNLGHLALKAGDHAAVRSRYEESLAIERELANQDGIAFQLANLGELALLQGRYAEARRLLEESLAIFRKISHHVCVALTLTSLAYVAEGQGDLEAARALHEESLTMFREQRQEKYVVRALYDLGTVAHRQGNDERAAALWRESLTLYRELGTRPVTSRDAAACIEALAGVARAQGQLQRAARLFGAARAMREALPPSAPHRHQAERDQELAALREAMGEAAFTAAWEMGRALTPGEAIAEALAAGA